MPADANYPERLPTLVRFVVGAQAILVFAIAIVWVSGATSGRPPRSLLFSSLVFGPCLILCIAAVLGMARGKTHGWACGLLGCLVTCAVFAVFATDLSVFPLGMIGMLMLRSVREFFTHTG